MSDIHPPQNLEAVRLHHDSDGNLTQVTLTPPTDNRNHTVAVTQGLEILADFDLGVVTMEKAGAHLILHFAQGGAITLENISSAVSGDASPSMVFQDGSMVSADQILATIMAAPEDDLTPAAGESGQSSGGVGEYEDHPGSILHSVEKLDGLDFSQINDSNPPSVQGLQPNTVSPVPADLDSGAGIPSVGIEVHDVGMTRDNTPTIAGTAGPDSTVVIEVGETTLGTTADGNGNWSVTIPAGTPLPDGGYTITGTATDGDGNSSTDTAGLGVDTTAIASIHLDAGITSNHILETAKLGGTIAVTGTVGGDVRDGDTVTVTVCGTGYTGTVANGVFSIDVPATELANDPLSRVEASVTATDQLGNTATAEDMETYNIVNLIIKNQDAPVAADDSAATSEVQSVDIDVLANDTPADGAALSRFDATSANGGTVTLNPDGTLNYSPADGFEGTDTFDYAITDPYGSTSVATVTITVNNGAPATVADHYAAVEGAGMVVDANSGVLSNDSDAAADTVTAYRFATDTSGANALSADGVHTVTTALGGSVVLNSDGSFHYTAPPSLDHTTSDTMVDSFAYQAFDGTDAGDWTPVNISVADGQPGATDIDHTLAASDGAFTYNLLIVLDSSGSMAWDINGNESLYGDFDPNTVRINIAKDAIAQMITKYDQLGNVNVQIVDFSSSATASQWFIDDLQAAGNYIDGIQVGGGTRYTTALDAAMDGFNPPPADKTLVYFISDGEPNSGYGISGQHQTDWENFVDANADIAFGVGIGEVSLDSLLPIACPDTGSSEDYAIKVTDAAQLSDTLLETVEAGVVSGTLSIQPGDGGGGLVFGPDGGHIESVTIDGDTRQYDPGNPEVTFTTPQGGQFTLNFDTGQYSYTLTPDTVLHGDEVIEIVGKDGDGDSAALTLTLHPQLDANQDIILTNVTPGTAMEIPDSALLHNDNGGNLFVGQVFNPQNGSVGTPDGVAFSIHTGLVEQSVASTINEKSGDSFYGPRNNTRENAVDLTDRNLFGAISTEGEIDANGYCVAYNGYLGNWIGRDIDYVKVHLHQGENLIVDVNGHNASVRGWVEYQDSNGQWQSVSISNTDPSPLPHFAAPEHGEYFIRLQTDGISGSNYDLRLTITEDSIQELPHASAGFSYSAGDGQGTDVADAKVHLIDGDTVTGGGKGEILAGGDANDTLNGNGGNDALVGNGGNDILVGGDGQDLMIGGIGDDTMSGGGGSDAYLYSAAGGEGADTITDFDVATDVIRLSDVLDADGDNDIDIGDLIHDGGQNVTANITGADGADVELTISNGAETTVVTLAGINAGHNFDGDTTLADLINHGLQIDIM
jgi:Ca2+-binding RTX toxin-like protein